MPTSEITLRALPGIPLVQPGDNLSMLILEAFSRANLILEPRDVLVVSSKIVSKAENRLVDLREITPSPHAKEVAAQTLKDPRLVELILRESVGVSRIAPYVLIVRHRLGFTSANAGIDQSNTGSLGNDLALLLPEEPDASAFRLAEALYHTTGIRPAVIISDTHGRPFRLGNLNVAIGLSGVPALLDLRGQPDLYGRTLQATINAFADQIAAAAGLVSGEADEGQPVILVRGLHWESDATHDTARHIIRPAEQDLYR